jgi:hypothetical protein
VLADIGRNSVSAVDDSFAVGNFVFAINENCAFGAQFVHDEAVVDDLLADINRWTEGLEGDADDIDGADYAGAESARLQ